MKPAPRLLALLWVWLAAPAVAQAYEPLYDNLNVIERRHVDAVLAERGLERDPAPAGKRFGELMVVTLDVFGDDTAWLRWANALHATTRAFVISDEVLFEPGQPFDSELVEETVRNLRQSVNLSVVALVPVRADDPTAVDILAVTRDTWSLRLSAQFNLTDGVLNSLFLAISERNLAGAHKRAAVILRYQQDTVLLGPRYIDPRLFRSRLQLVEELLFSINHGTGELEGTTNTFELALPLYSLESEWGFSLSEQHNIRIERLFLGDGIRTWSDPDTPEDEAVPFIVDTTQVDVRALVMRGLGRTPRHVISAGYGLSLNRFSLAAPEVDGEVARRFAAANLPRDDTSSFFLGRYRFFSGRYNSVRNYQTYGFTEDLLVGHDTGAEVRLGPRFLGSDQDAFSWLWWAGYTHLMPVGDQPGDQLDGAVLTGRVEVGARLEMASGEWMDRYLTGSLRLASPQWGPIRVHLGGRLHYKRDRVTTGLVQLGGANGLRGYPAGAFIGESLALGHLELRTLPLEILTLRIGAVAFIDAGTIWSEATVGEGPAELLSDVGLGLRLVVPQLQRFVFRFDYAFPLSGPHPTLPGTLTIGVEQVF